MKKILSTVLFLALSFLMFGNVSGNINNDTEKIQVDYYYSEWCGWCKKLDQYIEENDISNKVEINKIDVAKNPTIFLNTIEKLWLNSATVWIPFIVYIENGNKQYIQWWYYGWKTYFSKFIVNGTIDNNIKKSKKLLIKQLITSKNALNKNLKMKKYIKKIDLLAEKLSDKKLKNFGERLAKLPDSTRNNKKYKDLFDYLEAKVLLKVDLAESRKGTNNVWEEIKTTKKVIKTKVAKDFWDSIKLEQTDDNTYLTNKWKIVYTWKHESKTNPYIWDEACKPVWEQFEKNGNKDKQWVWDSLTEDERKGCLKESFKKKISIEKISNIDFVSFYEKGYESQLTYLLDKTTNKVIYLGRTLEVRQIEKKQKGVFILHGSEPYGTAEVIFNNWKENISLFKNNPNVGRKTDPGYIQIKKFLLIWDSKISIEYEGQYWKSEVKVINLGK